MASEKFMVLTAAVDRTYCLMLDNIAFEARPQYVRDVVTRGTGAVTIPPLDEKIRHCAIHEGIGGAMARPWRTGSREAQRQVAEAQKQRLTRASRLVALGVVLGVVLSFAVFVFTL